MAFDPTEYDIAAYSDGSIDLLCARPGCVFGPIHVSDDDTMPTLADVIEIAERHHAGTLAHIEPTKENI